MRELAGLWKRDKLKAAMLCCWLLTVFSSFFRNYLLQIPMPGIGYLFLFRIALPVTALLYVIYAVRERDAFWKNASAPEKWCWVLMAAMLLYGTVSLFRAINFSFTFQRLFNLYLDMCFFFLMLRLCRDKRVFRLTLAVCAAALAVICVMGVYEVFCGAVFNPKYNKYYQFRFFMGVFQWPVVTYVNTNDYAASLIFTGAVLLLFAAYHWKKMDSRRLGLFSAAFTLLYFLVTACSARLVIAAFYLLLAGFAAFLLIRDRRRLRVLAMIAVCMLSIQFAHHYRFIVPPIQEYLAEMKEYREQQANPPAEEPPVEEPPAEEPPVEEPPVEEPPAEEPPVEEPPVEEPPVEEPPVEEPPVLNIGDPKSEALLDTFYTVDKETGEKSLGRGNGSRVMLLLHAFRCFRESHFLGVGLGNTEMLAKERSVAPNGQINIHCFVARIIGDFGIFVLIPLAVIGFLLLKRVWQLLSAGLRRRDSQLFAFGVLYFFALLAYAFLSTASSDAQDLISMWIYLGSVVVFAEWSRQSAAGEDAQPEILPAADNGQPA